MLGFWCSLAALIIFVVFAFCLPLWRHAHKALILGVAVTIAGASLLLYGHLGGAHLINFRAQPFSAEKTKEYLVLLEQEVKATQNSAPVLRHYISITSLANHGMLNDTARELVAGLEEDDLDDPMVLNIIAVDAYQRKEYAKAINFWQKLLPKIEKDSEQYKIVQQAVVKAKRF